MALEPNEENIVAEFNGNGWKVMACAHRIFIPSKTRKTKKGKPLMMPVVHRWIDMDNGKASLRFYLSRSGRFSDSRQKDKSCALLDGCKGHDRPAMKAEIARMTKDLTASSMVVYSL